MITPTPAQRAARSANGKKAAAVSIAAAREHMGDFLTDIRVLGRGMSRLLRDRADRDAAAVVLATLDHPDPEYLHAAMVAVTAPQRLETVDFLTGTFPHGLDWAATEEAETVLNAAVAMGPREAAAGALLAAAMLLFPGLAEEVREGATDALMRAVPRPTATAGAAVLAVEHRALQAVDFLLVDMTAFGYTGLRQRFLRFAQRFTLVAQLCFQNRTAASAAGGFGRRRCCDFRSRTDGRRCRIYLSGIFRGRFCVAGSF